MAADGSSALTIRATATTDMGKSAAKPRCAATTASRFKEPGRRPGGLTESVIGIVLRNYDGEGSFSQASNVKGSITGTVPDAQGFGTYDVNADCSGIVRFLPAPGVVIEERMVIVDDGREIRTAVMVPTPVMITGVHQRIH